MEKGSESSLNKGILSSVRGKGDPSTFFAIKKYEAEATKPGT